MRFHVNLSHLGQARVCPPGLRLKHLSVLALVLFASIGFILSTTRRAASKQASETVRTDHPSSRSGAVDPVTQTKIKEAYGKLPLRFEANQGQADAEIKFSARGSGYALFLTRTEAVLALNRSSQQESERSRAVEMKETTDAGRARQISTVLRMRLKGADAGAKLVGVDELAGKANYLTSKDRALWRTDVPTYEKVRYEGIYKGVDLLYYGNQGQLEYDFEIAPGADPHSIQMAFEGAQKLDLDKSGDLLLRTDDGGVVRWHRPLVYQEVGGARREVFARYVLDAGRRSVGFRLGAYDRSRPLVIDPVLFYSTYFGGSNSDQGYGIAVDASGSAYITGTTGQHFPTTAGSFMSNSTDTFFANSFVTKLNAAGTAVVYSTHLGGGNDDLATSLGVDASGNALVTGVTCSNDFPILNAFQDQRRYWQLHRG
jgi:hypothetical protein